MNKAESERLGARLEEAGYRASSAPQADIIIVNSCVVRRSAENRVVNKLAALRALKQGDWPLIALTGCLVDADKENLHKTFPQVDYFFGPGEEMPWLGGGPDSLPRRPGPYVYVPIMQGCDNFCTFCIVPYRRGRERSRPLAEIVAEVTELVKRGTGEVTLLGQNVDSYGRGLPDSPDLADLLTALNDVQGLSRIRFLTSHPKDMSSRLIEAVATLDKVCEQINLPVQAGSDEILRAMGRGYTAAHYRRLVAEIRSRIPGVALSTDVIVGFPGESEEQFRETFDLLAELCFDQVHVAAYSVRPGTRAARNLADDVPAAEKKTRLDRIERLQAGIAAEINARLMGETVEVLVEGRRGGKWHGRTRTGKLVFTSPADFAPGELREVCIEHTSPWSLQARPPAGRD
jgi:tRNA-2-methylthio-N6-dimethylallyladenosine synthase